MLRAVMPCSRVAVSAVLVVLFGVHLGQRGGVLEHDAQQVGGGRLGPDRAAVSAFDQQRQPAAMVDVGMAEHDRGDGPDVEGERLEIAALVLVAALDHAAVEQHAVTRGLDLMHRPRDLTRSTVQSHSHLASSVLAGTG